MFSCHGIDFDTQDTMLAQHVERLLGGMCWFSNLWCPRIQFHIMKSILLATLECSLRLVFAQFKRNFQSPSWKQLNTSCNTCLKWIAGGNTNWPHVTSHLLGLLPFNHRAQHLHCQFYLHLTAMDSRNPLLSILNNKSWFPQCNRFIHAFTYDPILHQFLNPPLAFTMYLPMFQQTPQAVLRYNLLEELAIQKSNHIHSINSHSPNLLQISMLCDRISGLGCDVVLTAPACPQANFLVWHRGIRGWGRKCISGKRFDHGHTSCMPSPAINLNKMQQRLFALNQQLLVRPIQYTLVDFLLY